MKIPEETIQEIREATDIVGVVSQYVTLKKRGRTYMGLCPFHTEKTPSFSVDPVRGFYHCFGCGVGGNVFTFVMEMEKVSFPEAVRSLAEKAGISLPSFERDDEAAREAENLYLANRFAADFYQECLHKTESGRRALKYLEQRGFSMDTICTFGLGYAPNLWDGLVRKAERSRYPVRRLERAGLVVPRRGEGFYDRFRGRIMFPIANPSGRIVGFGGRILQEGEKTPKYINSPETLVYRKGRLLYGLNLSKEGIRREDRVILVEGYTDVMRLYQSGVDYGVATSGTALTDLQARALLRYSRNVILVYDGDSAGFAAALRGVDVLLEAGLSVEVSPLPGGSDPDTLIRDKGKEAFFDLLKKRRSFVDFGLEHMGGLSADPGEQAAGLRALMETLSRVSDPLERSLMVREVAEKTGVQEKLLMDQIRKGAKEKPDQTERKIAPVSTQRQNAEQNLIRLLLEDGHRWGTIVFRFVDPVHFQTPEARRIVEDIYRRFLKGEVADAPMLMDIIQDDSSAQTYLSRVLAEDLGVETVRSRLGRDCVLLLREEEIRDQIQDVRRKIKQEQSRGKEAPQIGQIYVELKKELEKIRKEIARLWKKEVEK
jgi:DNA primase